MFIVFFISISYSVCISVLDLILEALSSDMLLHDSDLELLDICCQVIAFEGSNI